MDDEKEITPLTYSIMRRRALGLKCPYCGEGKPFLGLFSLKPCCEVCGFVFCREPGYFLGSIYINYGLCGGISIVWAALASFVFKLNWFNRFIVPSILIVALSTWFYRYALGLWMAMDLSFDPPTAKDFENKEAKN